MSKPVADLLDETLKSVGVKTCYGVVGGTMNRIDYDIDRSEIDGVHTRRKAAGASAAAAEALLTGSLTACVATSGPGNLHFTNGLYEVNRNRAFSHAHQDADRAAGFESMQEIDHGVLRSRNAYAK